MSQIPRRTTTLSMTQPPKAKRTPNMSPFPSSQPPIRQESATPRAPTKTIDMGTPIVIEDADFGNMLHNNDLIQVLSSVEEKSTSTPVAAATTTVNNGKTPASEKKSEIPRLFDQTPSSVKAPKESKRSKNKKSMDKSNPSVDESTNDENSSSVVSVRSSVDTDITTPEENLLEVDSLIIPDDEDDIILAALKPSALGDQASTPTSYDSPRPNKTPGGTKIVRLSKGLRVSPFRKMEQLDNVSTIVNLSTVSEQSVENNLDSSPVVVKNGDGDNSNGATNGSGDATSAAAAPVSSRRISARKTYNTNRPLRELSFRNATREAYKKNGGTEESSNEATAVNDSVNVTVGSEIGCNLDDLPETPLVATAGQKRRRNEDGENSDHEDDDIAPPEPKKSLFQTYCAIM